MTGRSLRVMIGRWRLFVTKIVQRRQKRDGRTRYDVYVSVFRPDGSSDVVIGRHVSRIIAYRLSRALPNCSSRIESLWHKKIRGPKSGRPRQPAKASQGSENFWVWGWNCNGTKEKATIMGQYIEKYAPSVIGLSETKRGPRNWPLRIDSYQVLESRKVPKVLGSHGVALAVATGFQMCEVPLTASPYWVVGKIFGGTLTAPLIAVSYYIPTRSSRGRPKALREFRALLMRLLRTTHPLILTGDFNDDTTKARAWLREHVPGIIVNGVDGNPETFHRPGRRSRAIDHVMISKDLKPFCLPGLVLRDVECSDHWPLSVCLKGLGTNVDRSGTTSLRMDVDRLREVSKLIPVHNYWEGLPLDSELLPGDEGTDQLNAAFVETTVRVCQSEAIDCFKKPAGTRRRKSSVLRDTASALRKRKVLTQKLNRANLSPERIVELKAKLKEAKKISNQKMNRDRRASWDKCVQKKCGSVEGASAAKYWRFVHSTMRMENGTHRAGSDPIACPRTGEILTDCERISKAWETHYRDLASDVDGTSKRREPWEDQLMELEHHDCLEGLDDPLSWSEVCEIMSEMSTGKAAGDDAIILEFYRTARDKKDPYTGLYSDTPQTSMGQGFWRLLKRVWEKESIPTSWYESTVVSIPKKGDLTDMNNYRGISLMAVALKVVCSIINRRISLALEKAGRFDKSQAGFRSNEEAVGQAVCLFEILRRKQVNGDECYIAFIDMKKAFDTVPHAALLGKCRAIGIGGKILNLISAIYDNSSFSVKGAYGRTGLIQLLRGVRQGCPMSPTIFDVFINDLLQTTTELGTSVPGLSERISGLLFADDLVLMADSAGNLQLLLDHVSEWAEKWGMEFGHAKCKVMGIGGEGNSTHNSARGRRWYLSEEEIEVADEYVYLGLVFTHNLCLETMVEARRKAALKAAFSARPFFESSSMPLVTRVMVLKATIIPIALYGAELWGMKLSLTLKLTTVVNMVLRWIVGAKSFSQALTIGCLRKEFNIPTIGAQATRSRVRAWEKYRHLTTWIKTLIMCPMKSRSNTWVSGSARWITRFGDYSPYKPEDHLPSLTSPEFLRLKDVRLLTPTRRARQALKHVEKKLSAQDKALQHIWYKAHISNTPGYKDWHILSRVLPRQNFNITQLVRARCGGFVTAQRLAEMKLTTSEWKSKCPMCKADCPETLAHVMLDCRYWATQRGGIEQLIDEAKQIVKVYDTSEGKDAVVALLLGGSWQTIRMRMWCPKVKLSALLRREETVESNDDPCARQLDFSQVGSAPISITTEKINSQLINDVAFASGAMRVARFLGKIAREHTRFLLKLPTGASQERKNSNNGQRSDRVSHGVHGRLPSAVT